MTTYGAGMKISVCVFLAVGWLPPCRGAEGETPVRKHVVFVTGDEEYRSEESMPMLAEILQRDYPIRTTVLYAVNKKTGEIDPQTVDNIPGLDALATADLAVFYIRYRVLPDPQLQKILDYCRSGKPRAAFRTTNHAFRYRALKKDRRKQWDYGFGRRFFGQRFIGYQGGETDVTVVEAQKDHPILRGVKPFHAPSWLYWADNKKRRLPKDVVGLLMGHPTGAQNQPPVDQPCAWIRIEDGEDGRRTRVFYTSLGHPLDFKNESMRRMTINALLWALGGEDLVPAGGADATIAGDYDPGPVKVGGHKRGVLPPKGKPATRNQ